MAIRRLACPTLLAAGGRCPHPATVLDAGRRALRCARCTLLAEGTAPAWLVETDDHCGAQRFLWDLLLAERGLDAVADLLSDRDALKAALVERWRRLRAQRIAEEWAP